MSWTSVQLGLFYLIFSGIYSTKLAENHCHTPDPTNPCPCAAGFISNAEKTKCLEIATEYGDNCSESIQCSEFLKAGGSCIDGYCACSIGYHYLQGQCIKSHGLGEACQSSDECYVNFDNSAATCRNNQCQCDDNFYQREYRTCRRAALKVGDDCLIDDDCRFQSATCDRMSKICQSTIGTLSRIEQSIAIIDFFKAENINYTIGCNCMSDDDCSKIPSSICSLSKKCICKRGFFPSTDMKSCTAELGSSCDSTEKPQIRDTICFNGHWSCQMTKVANRNNRKCEKVTIKYNTSCLLDENCYIFGPDAICQKKKCICNENSHFVEKKSFCWINKHLNNHCQADEDCVQGFSNISAVCIKNLCSCPRGSHMNLNKTMCVQDVDSLGEPCIEDNDCKSIDFAICQENKCFCQKTYFPQDKKCIKGIGAFCLISDECKTNHSICSGNSCICDANYVPFGHRCLPVREYEHPCVINAQCRPITENSICTSKSQSLMNYSEKPTLNMFCRCPPKYHYNYGSCYRKQVLGEVCNHRGECYVNSHPESVLCYMGVCMCSFNAVQINSTFCQNTSDRTFPNIWMLILLIVSNTVVIIHQF